NDAGDGLLPAALLSTAGNISNSQCQVSWIGGANTLPTSTVYVDGNLLTLNLTLTFPASFRGSKIIYQAARTVAEVSSGWQPMGTFQVDGPTGAETISLKSARPARNIVAPFLDPQTLTFTFTDTAGPDDLGVANVL